MNKYQQDVLDFHRALLQPDGSGKFDRPLLRARLILEEAVETIRGLGYDVDLDVTGEPIIDESNPRPIDEVSTIDGICDTIYVLLGSIIEMGYDLDPFWNEVQRSNMAKKGGPIREDGKRGKPEGWTPPDIRGVLESQRKVTA